MLGTSSAVASRSTPTADVDHLWPSRQWEPVSIGYPRRPRADHVGGRRSRRPGARVACRPATVTSSSCEKDRAGPIRRSPATRDSRSGTVESLIWRARQALKREYASIASVNTVIGGVALGRWGSSSTPGSSMARRMHPVAALLGEYRRGAGPGRRGGPDVVRRGCRSHAGDQPSRPPPAGGRGPRWTGAMAPRPVRAGRGDDTARLGGASSRSATGRGGQPPRAPRAPRGQPAPDPVASPPSSTASGASASGTVGGPVVPGGDHSGN